MQKSTPTRRHPVIRVLCVEDNAMDRELIHDALNRQDGDFSLSDATDRSSLEALLARDDFDVVLTDLDILDFHGLEVIRRVQEKCPQTPVIVVTGTGSEEIAVEALHAGAADYIIKTPRHIAQLPHTIRRIVDAAQTKRRLAQRDANLRAIVESVQDAIIIVDHEGLVSYWNKSATEIFGYSADETMGRPMAELIIPTGSQRAHREGWSKFVETGPSRGIGKVVEVQARRKDGRQIPVELSVGTFQLDGQWHAVAVARDITERRKLEKGLREAQKLEAIGRLAGGLAHDFNNNLSVIIGFAQLLVSQTDPTDPRYELATEILDAGRRSAQLVSQLLTFSRKNEGHRRLLDVSKAVRAKEKIFSHLLGMGRNLELFLAEDLPPVSIDPVQLDQVLVNLVINARDALKEDGRVTIETGRCILDDKSASRQGMQPGEYVTVAVCDNGVGMDEDIQRKIFEPFFTTKAPGKGTGLGLNTVYGIVTHLGGDIRVQSQPGAGTTFEILLPAQMGDIDRPLAPGQDGRQITDTRNEPQRSRQILVVDDETSLRKLMVRILTEAGYEVLSAASGAEALSMVKGKNLCPDLLITDMLMPSIHGRQLADSLRRIHPHLQVLYVSGQTDEAMEDAVGDDSAFLQKPFDLNDFMRLVEKMLYNHL